MIEIIKSKSGFITLIVIHLLIGAMLKFSRGMVAMVFPVFFLLMFIDVIYRLDRGNRAGFYALYIMGFEMIYRMAGAPYSWELGKYLSIIILITGLIISKRKFIAWPFVLMLVLLIPAFFLVEGNPDKSMRSMILFNASGPLSLVFAGLYFYKRPFFEEDFFTRLRFAVLPAFTMVAGLTLVANISSLEFTSMQSSAQAAGGFGPNQVSTVLGWFILLVMLYKVNGKNITPYNWLDWVLLFYLVLRALITFSRGGVFGSVLALLGAIVVLYYSYNSFREKVRKAIPYVIMGIVFFVGVFLYANKLTNNYLLYRYQGKSTVEVVSGRSMGDKSMLSGRDELLQAEIDVFLENPILGVGFGMGESYRSRRFGQAAASHTEYTRLLSEHGLFGVFFILVGMIILPFLYFYHAKHPVNKCFFIAFFLLSIFTMFHGAMRLALPGVLMGAAFMRIMASPKEDDSSDSQTNDLAID